jgi:exodeoxyribonuclease VII large subunit
MDFDFTHWKPPEKRCYTISEITSLIRSMLENEFPDITLEGEISNFRPSSTGHYYFSLKDDQAIISVVMFKNRLAGLNFKPADGLLVRARGSISVYNKRGTYQLVCEELVQSGKGNILAMLEQRKQELAREGLFDQEYKKPLPLLPARVAVITSPTGAAIRDILRVLKRRHSGINLVILPAPVQGEEAPSLLVEQIKTANKHKLGDVIILTRGGGSLEDLLPFSDEAVVRAVYESKIPVISAVGHEIDITLSDLVADVRAPTPSAAAEMVSASRDELLRRVYELNNTILVTLTQRMEKIKLLVSQFTPENMENNFRLYIQPLLLRFDDAKENLINTLKDIIKESKHRLELLKKELEADSPLSILERGYAVVTHDKTGEIIISQKQVAVQEDVDITLYKGKLKAQVKEKMNHEKL